jgi:hypothetical protein
MTKSRLLFRPPECPEVRTDGDDAYMIYASYSDRRRRSHAGRSTDIRERRSGDEYPRIDRSPPSAHGGMATDVVAAVVRDVDFDAPANLDDPDLVGAASSCVAICSPAGDRS